MTLLDKMLELARNGYSVTIGDYKGLGIRIGVSKDIICINQVYTFEDLDYSVLPLHMAIEDTIDMLTSKLDRRISVLDSTILEGDAE